MLSTQVSQMVLSAHLNFLQFITTVRAITSEISYLRSSVHKNDKSLYQLIWPFYGLLQPYEQKFQKAPISVNSVHKYHKSCTQLNWPF